MSGEPGGAPTPRRGSADRWRSLRGRATLAFASLAFLVTVVTVAGVWLTVSQYLLLQREKVAVAQTLTNADRLQRGLGTEGISPPDLLSQLPRERGSSSLLAEQGQWYTTSLQVGRDDLPVALRSAVRGGQEAQQRITVDGSTVLAVGVPLAGTDRAYFEVFPLTDLDETYRTLGTVLLAATALVPGIALLLGRWVTRPALRPLERVGTAAAAVAAGDLRARIDPRGDPDLLPIASSFNQTTAALERRVQADARFAADVAHELRTPLTAMLGALALVEVHRHHLPEDGREGLDLLHEETARFHRLVQDLLEISRADAGSADPATEDVVLTDLVRWTLPAPLRSRLVADPSAGALVIRADKRRLRQVVANLVDNAEKHGGGLSRVTVTRSGDRALVLVDDAGPGVDPEERDRIFERFARGRRSARVASEGAGLGLSLVVRHLHLLGGEVTVGTSPDGGARFAVSLPADEARPEEAACPA